MTLAERAQGFLGDYAAPVDLRVVSASPDGIVATWQVGPHLHQPAGIVHGGVHCTVVESLASVAAVLWLEDRGTVVGVNNSTDFYRAVRDGVLTSTASPLHRGRSQQVWVVDTTDAEGRLVARGQVRLQNLSPARSR